MLATVPLDSLPRRAWNFPPPQKPRRVLHSSGWRWQAREHAVVLRDVKRLRVLQEFRRECARVVLHG
ncbi:MAG TPA: hypothetical protein VMV18_08510 [bacterium]|nr:hypothetical protein [bacterium]